MMAAMPPDAMGGMDADMMAAMPPNCMEGMSPDMMAAMRYQMPWAAWMQI